MNITALEEAVKSYEVEMPYPHTGNSFNDWWVNRLKLKGIGQGRQRDYSNEHVRQVVAWRLVSNFMGDSRSKSAIALRRRIIERIVESEQGFVVVHRNRVRHSTQPPQASLVSDGHPVVVFKVPEWRH